MRCLLVILALTGLSCTHIAEFGKITPPANYISQYQGKAQKREALIVLDPTELPMTMKLFTAPWYNMVHTDIQNAVKDALGKRLKKVFTTVKFVTREKLKNEKTYQAAFYPSLSINYHYRIYSRNCDVNFKLRANDANGAVLVNVDRSGNADSGLNYELDTLCKRALDDVFDTVTDLALNAVVLSIP